MSTYQEVEPFLITTEANTNKNLSSKTYQYAFGSTNVAAGSFTSRSYTIPLSAFTRLYQIYINLSIDGDLWTAMPCRDRSYASGNRIISANMSQNGDNITLNLFFVNQTGSTQTFPTMTVSATRRDFVDEI